MNARAARWAPMAIAALALIASIAGIRNGFTYDDRYIVQLNPAMHDLAHWWRAFTTSYWPRDWGGDGYRPLTMLFFRVEYAIGGGSPMPFHAMNIVLYAVSSMLVLALARHMLPLWAACIVAALFAVHPVHVEAVANVVGQSELLVAITVLPALVLYIAERRARPGGFLSIRGAAVIALLYLLGCMSKEHAIVLPALLLAADLTIIEEARSVRSLIGDRRVRIFYLSLAAIAILFIALRAVVIADHGIGGFQPFTPFSSLKITRFQRTLTAISVVPEWLRLFYWPARLSSEYGPPDIQIAQGMALWQLPGFLLLVGTLALGFLLRRREPVISFAIAFVCVALLPSSNFLVPAGIVLAERTLFLPSVGAMLVLGGIVVVVARRSPAGEPRSRSLALAAVAAVLIAATVRSVSRTAVWKDNETLFNRAVIDSPLSYRAHYMLGAWSFENGRKRIGEEEYHRALSLFPYDPALSYNMAEQYRRVGMCAPAVPLYRWTRDLDPNFPYGRAAHAECLLEIGRYDDAKQMALLALSAGGEVKLARRLIFLADSARSADTAKQAGPSVGLAGSPSKLPDTMQKAR
jgi:hypothetical protein